MGGGARFCHPVRRRARRGRRCDLAVTGRSALRSALRMVLIGSGTALTNYLIGSLIGVTI
jgi:hypothetical protein